MKYCPKCGYKRKQGQKKKIVWGSCYGGTHLHSASFIECPICKVQYDVVYPQAVGTFKYERIKD